MATASDSAGGPPPLPPRSSSPAPQAPTPQAPGDPRSAPTPPALPRSPSGPAVPPAARQAPRPVARPLRAGLIPWAETEAGVQLAAGPQAIRTALVERLQAEIWIPSASLQYAFETLAVGPERLKQLGLEPSAGDHYLAAEKALSAEIEAFAGEFFQREPAARSERWRDLAERSVDFPALLSRLRHLRPGLEAVLPPADAEPVLKSLAEHLAELFTLPSHERARRRRFPSERFEPFVTRWPAAAARLRQQFPKLALLEPRLIDQLTRTKQLATRGYAAPGVRLPDRPVRVSEYAVHEKFESPSEYRRQRRKSISVGGISWLGIFGVGLLIKLIVALSRIDSPNSGGTYTPPPSGGSTYYYDQNRGSNSNSFERRPDFNSRPTPRPDGPTFYAPPPGHNPGGYSPGGNSPGGYSPGGGPSPGPYRSGSSP